MGATVMSLRNYIIYAEALNLLNKITNVGKSFMGLTDPGEITFPRINADSTVDTLTDAEMRMALGVGAVGDFVESVSATAPIVSSGTTDVIISMPVATALVDGYLDKDDFTTFLGKQDAFPFTIAGTAGQTYTFPATSANIPGLEVTTNQVFAGPIQLPNGTAAAPAIRVSSSEVSGFYRWGATSIGVSIGGTEASRLTYANVTGWGGGIRFFLPNAGDKAMVYVNINTGLLQLGGGAGDTNGGQICLYGSSHATKPGWIEFYTATTLIAQYNASSWKFGSATNYTEIEADGTTKFVGNATVWEDLNFDPVRSGGPASTRPDDVTINNVFHKEFTSANNQLCGSTQEITHKSMLGRTLYPHCHVFLKASESAGTTGVTFTLYWELRQSTGTTSGSVAVSATSAQLSGNANILDLFDNTGFTGPTVLGGQLAMVIARTGGNAGDIIITSYGVHYEIDTIGSRSITTK
jgi:hypothetical protein